MSATPNAAANNKNEKVNWSVRLDDNDAERWDDLHHALRRETGQRTLSKADAFRGVLDLFDNPDERRKLVDILTGIED